MKRSLLLLLSLAFAACSQDQLVSPVQSKTSADAKGANDAAFAQNNLVSDIHAGAPT